MSPEHRFQELGTRNPLYFRGMANVLFMIFFCNHMPSFNLLKVDKHNEQEKVIFFTFLYLAAEQDFFAMKGAV